MRTAQRYMRLAEHWPCLTGDATRVSHASQAEAARAIRRALFATERKRAAAAQTTTTTAVPAGSAASRTGPLSAPKQVPAPRVASLAVAGLDRLAASLRNASTPGDAAATHIIGRIEALSADIRLDSHEDRDETARQLVYFAEALGADRVKIGVAEDPVARLASLRTACPHPLCLLAAVPGGRLLEAALHARFAPFHLGGEWFHLAKPVRAMIDAMAASSEGAGGPAPQ